MASAMRKMAVYLGLVEDDHRYQDKYDSYGEYEDYDDQADRPEQIDEPEVRGVGRDGVGRDGEVGGGPISSAVMAVRARGQMALARTPYREQLRAVVTVSAAMPALAAA